MLLRSILHPAECLLWSQLTWEWPVEGAECPNKATLVLVLPDESQCDLTHVYVHHCALWLHQCRTWLFPLAPSSSFPFIFVFSNFGCWLLCCCFFVLLSKLCSLQRVIWFSTRWNLVWFVLSHRYSFLDRWESERHPERSSAVKQTWAWNTIKGWWQPLRCPAAGPRNATLTGLMSTIQSISGTGICHPTFGRTSTFWSRRNASRRSYRAP